MTSIPLASEDLRIIGHSINWELTVPFERTRPPDLSEQDTKILSLLFEDCCNLGRADTRPAEAVQVEIGESHSRGAGRLKLPLVYLRLMTEAVASFRNELESSPQEIEIITGAPSSRTSDLLARMQAFYRSQSYKGQDSSN